MASFYAELHVAGLVYPLRTCIYSFSQATDGRGKVVAKVRHHYIEATADVPDDELLAAWATTAYRPLAGHVVFFETKGTAARETVSWQDGHCVGYCEDFVSGSLGAGAYVCRLTIVAPKLVLSAGGPRRPFVAPAPREYAYVPPPLTGPVAAPLPLSKQQRYDARMSLMGDAQTKLANSPHRPEAAQSALERLQRDNVAVERAKLAEHVYHSDKIPPVPEPEGWHMLTPDELAKKGVTPEMLRDPKSGYKAALYESSFERPPKLVVSYAGTEDKKDWIADARQGMGLKEKQYNSAMNLARAVAKTSDVLDIETTGHSLGGGLAAAGCVVTGTKSYTFNAAGLHVNTARRPPYGVSRQEMQEKGALIDAYRSTSDPLNNLQNLSNVTRGRVMPKALGVDHPLTPAPKWQHQWNELHPLRPKQSLKSAVKMALDGHGVVPQLVDHIEHRKDQDTATLTKYLDQ